MTRCARSPWWLAALLVTALLGATAQASAQAKRLVSRAAFAGLDSAALADSAGMTALDHRDSVDVLLLDMHAALDSSVGRRFGISGTRIRRWDGFSSQAHPALGILVDGEQVRGIMTKVSNMKGMRGIPPAEIAARMQWVVRYIVAHEYAHMVQYAHFGRDTVERPGATRVIECAADLIAGFQYQTYLGARAAVEPVPAIAGAVATDFGYVIGAADWLDATTHPLPEQRRQCISHGIETARGNETSFARERATFMAWSMEQSRVIVAQGAIASGDMSGATVRDTSVGKLVVLLTSVAAKGSDSMAVLRADRAPGDSSWLLRASLAPPWRCTIALDRAGETASCSADSRTSSFNADTQFDELAARVREALKGSRWRETRSTAAAPAPPMDRPARRSVYFTLNGGNPDRENVARVEVYLFSLDSMTSQSPPSYTVGISVRAGRGR